MKKLLLGAAAGLAALVAVPATAGASTAPVVTLLHGIPGVTVDVYVNGAEVIPNFEPGKTADLSSFAGATLTNVEVRPDGSTTPVITVPSLAVPSSGNWTVVAHLKADGTPTITPFENDVSAVPDGQGRLIVRHTAQFGPVDVVLADGTTRPITNLANPQEKALVLPAGPYSGLQLAPAGGAPAIPVPSVTLAAGTDLIVYAVGDPAANPSTFTFYTQEIVLHLPETGAAQTVTMVAVGSLVALLGVGMFLVSRRRTVTA